LKTPHFLLENEILENTSPLGVGKKDLPRSFGGKNMKRGREKRGNVKEKRKYHFGKKERINIVLDQNIVH
jgi:hypothetical protein